MRRLSEAGTVRTSMLLLLLAALLLVLTGGCASSPLWQNDDWGVSEWTWVVLDVVAVVAGVAFLWMAASISP